MYQSRTGRFTTVDPMFTGLFEPQKWNRYSYAFNSPLGFADPEGLEGQTVNCGLGTYWCPGTIQTGQHSDIYFDPNSYGYQGGEEAARAEAVYAFNVMIVFAEKVNTWIQQNAEKAQQYEVNTKITFNGQEISLKDCTVDNGCMKLGVMPLTPGAIGAAGERVVEGIANIGDKTRFLINGRSRIADGLLADAVTEIKNVAYQARTGQLRDYMAFAGSESRHGIQLVGKGDHEIIGSPERRRTCRSRPHSYVSLAMKKSEKKSPRAAEFLAELQKDPAYRELRERQSLAAQELREKVRVAEAPIIEDLKAVGVKVSSVWDLVNTRSSYSSAIPVLLEHLGRDYPAEVREGIARALAVPEASWAWDVLLTFFKREPTGQARNVKWALACALSGGATDEVIDTIIGLVQDTSIGENRLALLSALARSKMPKTREVLEQLRQDPQLSREIRILLGRPKKKS